MPLYSDFAIAVVSSQFRAREEDAVVDTLVGNDLLSKAKSIARELIEIRRCVHANPELSFKETATVKFVQAELAKIGVESRSILGGTAVVADIGSGDPVLAIRADMDALPIDEANEVGYKSTNSGVMHACGHDAHTACSIGAARLLSELQSKGTALPGRVRFLFQPAEEQTNADGKSGAGLMIEEGVLAGVKSAIAVHVFPDLPCGMVAIKEGPLLSACDTFTITIKGHGAHGAMPHLGVDAIVIASHVVQAIQTITSRRKSALEPAVITIGGIRSGTFRPNIIAEEVEIVGTVRYFNDSLQDMWKTELVKCCNIAEAMGGSFSLSYVAENPALVNDPVVTQQVIAAAARLLGEKNIVKAEALMGADDFAFISAAVPSCYIALGAELPGDPRKLHTPTFDINEEALVLGAALLAECAVSLLSAQ